MVDVDWLVELRQLYEYWVQVKQTVYGWSTEYGWLVELTVVGFMGLFAILFLILLLLGTFSSASEPKSVRQVASGYAGQDTYHQLDWRGFLALVVGALVCGTLLMFFTSWLQ
jgi:hypothetical protein